MKTFLLVLALLLLSLLTAIADDSHPYETQRLNDSAAIHGTLNPRIYSPPVGQSTSQLALPLPSDAPPIDYRLSQPEPQRLWEPREWKQ